MLFLYKINTLKCICVGFFIDKYLIVCYDTNIQKEVTKKTHLSIKTKRQYRGGHHDYNKTVTYNNEH